MMIHVVILTTEHGDDVAARHTYEEALKAAGEMIVETIDELEREIDGNTEGETNLAILREFLAEGQFEQAMSVYNDLHEEHVSSADAHHLRIKEVDLK